MSAISNRRARSRAVPAKKGLAVSCKFHIVRASGHGLDYPSIPIKMSPTAECYVLTARSYPRS
jgi:hypothetical protein